MRARAAEDLRAAKRCFTRALGSVRDVETAAVRWATTAPTALAASASMPFVSASSSAPRPREA